ncbi:helix-turn-helix domain-containing protein [Helicobacter cetorum]|uniref:helix-turn-helix domain-containing protein n=1 Tax=Helicobacter cetorum TaxID=138563 RepID=UPI000CF13DA6|nr:helix-turn-helix domain-containing protein [Helicobacter cetorum]
MNYILKNNLKIDSNYTKVGNDIIFNSSLSPLAKLLFITLGGLATNFNPRHEFLCKELQISLKTLNKYMNELVEKGYLKIVYFKNKLGRFLGKKGYILLPNKEQLEHNEVIILDNKTENFTKPKNPEKQATKRLNTETPTETANFTPLNNKKNNNKHENMSACKNFQKEKEKSNHSIKSPIKNLSAFNYFKNFIDSILGNLDTSDLNDNEKMSFERFLNYRHEKSKLTYNTKKALLMQCLELKSAGHNLEACLNQSIRRNYNEVYPLMKFNQPSIKRVSTHELLQDEIIEIKPNPAYGGYCIF